MSQQQTLTALRALKLTGMADALERQFSQPQLQESSFDVRLDMLVDAERLARENRRLSRLLKQAQLKVQAAPEDIDYRASRGLDKRQVNALLGCEDPAAAEPHHHRPHWRRQNVARVRVCPAGRPPRAPRSVPPATTTLRGTRGCTRDG